MVEKGREKMKQAPWAQFLEVDLCKDFHLILPEIVKRDVMNPTIITSFEFIEHIPEDQVEPFLVNVKSLMRPNTKFFLSTPCYDGKNKAANHIKEWTYQELKTLLEKHFTIEAHYGTFMSQKDLKQALVDNEPYAKLLLEPFTMGPGEQLIEMPAIFQALRDYYDSNLLSILFAPLFPSYARNAIWRLRLPK